MSKLLICRPLIGVDSSSVNAIFTTLLMTTDDRKSPSTNWKIGLALSIVAVLFWGVLPLALTITLGGADAYTVTWFRFTVAGIVLGAMMFFLQRLPSARSIHGISWIVLLVAVVGLAGNYLLFLIALSHTSPTVTQTLAQLSSIFLLLGGVFIFKERFSRSQTIGLIVLVVGLALFFNQQLLTFNMSRSFALGALLAVLSAIVWTGYGLAQKRLLEEFGSQQVLLLIFIGSSILLLPLASPRAIPKMNWLQMGMLLFCCANSLIAYGSFAEALKHWNVSRVGAVIATAPLFTFASMWVAGRVAPELFASEKLNVTSLLGVLFIVGGSALCALAGRQT